MQKKNIDLEIDLKENIVLLWKNKITIVFVIFIFIATSYTYISLKLPLLKSGVQLVYLGEAKTEKGFVPIGNKYDLKVLIEKSLNNIKINIPNQTSNIIEIISINKNEEIIKNNIEKAYLMLLDVEKERIIFYSQSIKTHKINDTLISIEKKRNLKRKIIVIVSALLGFLASFLLISLLNYLKKIKEEEND